MLFAGQLHIRFRRVGCRERGLCVCATAQEELLLLAVEADVGCNKQTRCMAMTTRWSCVGWCWIREKVLALLGLPQLLRYVDGYLQCREMFAACIRHVKPAE